LSLAIYLTIDSTSGQAVTHWILIGCLFQVCLGVVIGSILGLVSSFIMKRSYARGYINRESYVAQYLVMAIFVTGVVIIIGSDDLLAVFAAGCAISWDGEFNEHTEGEVFITVIDFVLNCGCFIYIGAWMPFNQFVIPDLGFSMWRLGVLTLGIMTLRRIPAIMLLYKWIPEIGTWREALFSGHFGPMGVGAIFISALAAHRLPTPSIPPVTQKDVLASTLQPVVAFVVLASIIIHGLSIPFFKASVGLTRKVSTSSLSTRHAPDWLLWSGRPLATTVEIHEMGLGSAAPKTASGIGVTSTTTPREETLTPGGRQSPRGTSEGARKDQPGPGSHFPGE